MEKYKVAILKNETSDEHIEWVTACETFSSKLEYSVIDLVEVDWLEKVLEKDYDIYLTRAPGRIAYFKQLYDERIYIINKVLNKTIYPTLNELLVYENKRLLSYYLNSKTIPHPRTWVYYNKQKAIEFANSCELPVVAKTNIGAGGSGVKIFRDRKAIFDYIESIFSQKGVNRNYLPNFRKGNYFNRIKKRLGNIEKSIEYFQEKKTAATIDSQKWFVLFQEYIKVDYEWRCVVIDDSYFGHKKLKTFGEMMSGTSKVSWDYPNEELLNFLKKIVTENSFLSQAIDLFYDENRGYLVNELQCFWGSKNPHQMIKDDKPGRFVFRDNVWIFEEGTFNQNNSYNLRLQHVLKILENNETVIF